MWTICSEKTSDWLIFGERPEPFAHSCSFVMRDLSNSLISLFKLTKKCPKNMILFNIFFCKSLVFVSKRAIEQFAIKNKQFAHLLFYHEWPEQIAHSRYFVLSNLSDFLTVAHLSWATRAISSQLLICPERSEQANRSKSLITMSNFEQMSNERMS